MKIKDISKWRSEIGLAEKFREDEFGAFEKAYIERLKPLLNIHNGSYPDSPRALNYFSSKNNT